MTLFPCQIQAQLPQPTDDSKPTVINVLVVGDYKVGKSTLIDALSCGTAPDLDLGQSVLGPSMWSASARRHVRMLYWEQFAPNDAPIDLLLGCFSADSPSSIMRLAAILSSMTRYCQKGVDPRGPPLLLVQCKVDLAPALHVATFEAAHEAIPDSGSRDSHRMMLPASGKNGEGVLNVARAIVAGALQRQVEEVAQRRQHPRDILRESHDELSGLRVDENRESKSLSQSMQRLFHRPWQTQVAMAVQQSQDAKRGIDESHAKNVIAAAVTRAYKAIASNGVKAEVDLKERNLNFGSAIGSRNEYDAAALLRKPGRTMPSAVLGDTYVPPYSIKDRIRALRNDVSPVDAWTGNLGMPTSTTAFVSDAVLAEGRLRHFVSISAGFKRA